MCALLQVSEAERAGLASELLELHEREMAMQRHEREFWGNMLKLELDANAHGEEVSLPACASW
jgi:hypothetical protein